MTDVVLSFVDSGVPVPLVGVCAYPQYDIPPTDIKDALSDYIEVVLRSANNAIALEAERTAEQSCVITIHSNDIPADIAATRRVVNRLMNTAHDFFYHPDTGSNGMSNNTTVKEKHDE